MYNKGVEGIVVIFDVGFIYFLEDLVVIIGEYVILNNRCLL